MGINELSSRNHAAKVGSVIFLYRSGDHNQDEFAVVHRILDIAGEDEVALRDNLLQIIVIFKFGEWDISFREAFEIVLINVEPIDFDPLFDISHGGWEPHIAQAHDRY